MMNIGQYYINEQSDFFSFMIEKKLFSNPKTYHDYLARVRYVSQFYKLDKDLTQKDVDAILNELKENKDSRDRYNTPKGISDLGSGLRRFLEYVKSDYRKQLDQTILSEEAKVSNDVSLPETEREAIVRARVGQGEFRSNLVKYWNGCSVTKCKTVPLLVASHIRPWRRSDNAQRLDVYNGLLLTPNLDKLFDKGYISFSDKGQIICSEALPKADIKIFGISDSMKLARVEVKHQQYLKYHRDYCLL